MGLNAEVLGNTLEFLRRVDMKGLEAFGFVSAYTAIQNELALVQNPQLALALQTYQQRQPAPPAPDSAASAYVPDDQPLNPPFYLGIDG
jgi:hypothetical protein